MKIGIVTNGTRSWASSRMRGHWYEDVCPEVFTAYQPGQANNQDILTNDVIVFQKRQGESDLMRARWFKSEGKKIVYDITEPMWLWQHQPDNFCEEMVEIADAVTVSSLGLYRAARLRYPDTIVKRIDDFIKPDFHPTIAKHPERPYTKLVWFGLGQNRISLIGAMPLIHHLSSDQLLELVIIDDLAGKPSEDWSKGNNNPNLKITHVMWTLDTFHANLVSCDIAVLPPYPGIWGEMKSENKKYTAWWCGLPAVTNWRMMKGNLTSLQMELEKSRGSRQSAGKGLRLVAEEKYHINHGITAWKELAETLLESERKP